MRRSQPRGVGGRSLPEESQEFKTQRQERTWLLSLACHVELSELKPGR